MCHGTFYCDITVCIEMFKITESSVTIKVKQGEDPNEDNTQAAGIGQTKSELQLNKAELIKKKKKNTRDPWNQKQVKRTKDKVTTKRTEAKCKLQATYKSMKSTRSKKQKHITGRHSGEDNGWEHSVTSQGNTEEDGHAGWRNELTKTRGRTKTIYTDTLTRVSETDGVRREKDRWGKERKHTGREKTQEVTHEGFPLVYGAVAYRCLKIKIHHHGAWPHLTLRPTHPWAHRRAQVHLRFMQPVRENDNCISLKLAMMLVLCSALCRA